MDANEQLVHADVVEMLRYEASVVTDRLVGLTDEEYRWMPVPGSWTLQPNADGVTGTADWADPDPVPPPITTICWRMWHLTDDCFASYSARLFGATTTRRRDRTFTLSAAEGIDALTRSWQHFADGVGGWTMAQMLTPLGKAWGPYATSTHLALAFHAQHELVHHGAEIALLRDLYAARP